MTTDSTPEIHVILRDGTLWHLTGTASRVEAVTMVDSNDWVDAFGPLYREDRRDASLRSSAIVAVRASTPRLRA